MQVGEEQLPQLHLLLLEAADILNVDAPALYVRHSPHPTAHAWDVMHTRPMLVLSSSLIELLKPAELQAVMASRLAQLNTPQYRPAATAVAAAATAADALHEVEGVRAMWHSLVVPSLSRWERYADLSADRAALVVAQNLEVVVSAIMKVASGSRTLAGQLSVKALLERSRAGLDDQQRH